MEKYSIEPYVDDKKESSSFRKEEAYLRAKKRVDQIAGFYWHLVSYIAVNLFLILLIGFSSDQGFSGFGPYATAVFWGIGLFFHFVGVFGFNFAFGQDWEQRKIEEYMEKEQRNFDNFNL